MFQHLTHEGRSPKTDQLTTATEKTKRREAAAMIIAVNSGARTFADRALKINLRATDNYFTLR